MTLRYNLLTYGTDKFRCLKFDCFRCKSGGGGVPPVRIYSPTEPDCGAVAPRSCC